MTNSHDTLEHPTDEQLAAFLDGRLTGLQRDRVLIHLAACSTCRNDTTAARRVLERSHPAWTVWRRPVMVLAAAALAFVVVPRFFSATPSVSERASASAQPDLMPRVSVVDPADQSVVADPVVRFRWRAAGVGVTYHVSLQDGTGRLLWETTGGDTSVAVPRDVVLEKAQSYFWSVDARLADGRSASSGAQRFSVR